MPDYSRLIELVVYEKDTGNFLRRATLQKMQTNGGDGYLCVNIDGVSYRANRLAWYYVTGKWPEGEIDHKDKDRTNNRWRNLREVTTLVNAHNRGMRRDNTSGHQGVRQKGSRFVATIIESGKPRNLGSFATIEEASAKYQSYKAFFYPLD